MNPRTEARLAWSLCGLSVAFAAFGLLFLLLNGTFASVFEKSVGVDAAAAVAFPVVGAVVASRRPDNAVGWLFCAIGLSQGAAVFFGEYAIYAFVTEPGALLPGRVAFWLGSWTWLPGVLLTLTFLLLLFPDGRLPSSRWRPVAWLSAVVTALGVLVLAVAPWDLLEPGLPADNPFGPEGVSAGSLRVLAISLFVLGAMCALLSALSLILRFRRSRGEERQQLKWFVYAGVSYILTILIPLPAISNLQIVTAPMLPIAAGIAILRYRLYEIDRIINRTLVYGVLTTALVAIYVGGVVGLQYLFRLLTGQESQLAVVVSTLAIAALFVPLRQRIQAFIDRRFYRKKYDAAKTLEAFSAKLRDRTDLNGLTEELVAVVRETMQPNHVSLWLRPPGRSREKPKGGGE